MRKVILFFFISIVCLNAFGQISVGIRNNRFINATFLYKDHYSARLEQSIFSEKFGYQYMRGYLGYQTTFGNVLQLFGTAYFGSTFNRFYCSTGASVHVRIHPYRIIILDAKINPHYDSGFGYTTCYYAGIGSYITKQIDFLIGFSNIPEYRMPEKRLSVGFDFHIKNIKVLPKLSLNLNSEDGPKSLRPIIDFEYTFHSRHE